MELPSFNDFFKGKSYFKQYLKKNQFIANLVPLYTRFF